MERRQRAAQIDADAGDLASTHRTSLADHGGQRLPLDELHPDADLISESLGAVDRDDVRVTHPREMPRFVDGRPCGQLEKALARDLRSARIPGAVHGADAPCRRASRTMGPQVGGELPRAWASEARHTRKSVRVNDSTRRRAPARCSFGLVLSRAHRVPIDPPSSQTSFAGNQHRSSDPVLTHRPVRRSKRGSLHSLCLSRTSRERRDTE